MTANRTHLPGLQLALTIADTVCTDSISVIQLERLIEEADVAHGDHPVAIVEYTGYEPANSLRWLNKGLDYMEPGAKLYTAPQHDAEAELVALLSECLSGLAPWPDLGDRIRAKLKALRAT